jgi:hypothetical protein
MNTMPLLPPILIRTLAEYKWKDAISYMIFENKDYVLVSQSESNIWKHTIERDLNNKLYAYQNTYQNNNIISSKYIKLPKLDPGCITN